MVKKKEVPKPYSDAIKTFFSPEKRDKWENKYKINTQRALHYLDYLGRSTESGDDVTKSCVPIHQYYLRSEDGKEEDITHNHRQYTGRDFDDIDDDNNTKRVIFGGRTVGYKKIPDEYQRFIEKKFSQKRAKKVASQHAVDSRYLQWYCDLLRGNGVSLEEIEWQKVVPVDEPEKDNIPCHLFFSPVYEYDEEGVYGAMSHHAGEL